MNEITLETGVPLLIVPGGTMTVHNTMTSKDPLFVSSHGDVNKKWLEVEQDDYVKFAFDLYLLQKSNGQVILPAILTV